MVKYIRKADNFDILIIAEGTYPYVKGGVSSWIHQLLTGLSEFKFGIVFLGSREEDYGDIRYKLPDNLVHLEVHYLFGKKGELNIQKKNVEPDKFKYVYSLHEYFGSDKNSKNGDYIPDYIKSLDFYNRVITEEVFLYSKNSWEFITENYYNNCPNYPFVDYFWTVRNIHSPIWVITDVAQNLKGYKVIHSPSTGYAGFLGALLHFDTGKPFILTEHGIYVRERKIDLLSADWIEDKRNLFQKELGELDYLKKMWIKFFEGLGKFTYKASNPIISLFEIARQIQIRYGADPEKTIVIPNGVDVKGLGELVKKRPKKVPKVITLIGRVVPIKDIKTFIKAMRIVANYIPDVEGWIVGPEDEDPNYAEECHFLVDSLGLQENVKFLGFQNIKDILPKTGILTLTSISEGMPLVIIEGFAAGVPAITTDVGSCSQLIYGGIDEEDKKLGKAGEVVPIANPEALAEAYVKLLKNEDLWNSCQKVALERVRKYYSLEKFLNSYRNIYKEALNSWQE
ncbi:MAG: glycosyl transferase family 1 [Persephonella sp.]|nr:MAG: glycosyl transferase family 1 [Persephonella sp.]